MDNVLPGRLLGVAADRVALPPEAFEAIEIGGPGDQAHAVVVAIAATLAASVLAEVTTLVGVGIGMAGKFLCHGTAAAVNP